MGDITVQVDGLGVEVDEDEFLADPEATADRVRQARAVIRIADLPDDPEPDPDYHQLYGKDDA